MQVLAAARGRVGLSGTESLKVAQCLKNRISSQPEWKELNKIPIT